MKDRPAWPSSSTSSRRSARSTAARRGGRRRFFPFMHASRFGRGTVLRLEPDGPAYDVAGRGRGAVLEAAAVLGRRRRLTLFAVNRGGRGAARRGGRCASSTASRSPSTSCSRDRTSTRSTPPRSPTASRSRRGAARASRRRAARRAAAAVLERRCDWRAVHWHERGKRLRRRDRLRHAVGARGRGARRGRRGARLGGARVRARGDGRRAAARRASGCRRTGRCRTPTTTSSVLRNAVPEALAAGRGATPATSSGSAPTSRRARRCRCSPTARRCAGWRSSRERPHAYVKLWKHHAAQSQADRITRLAEERGERWLAALRRAHLVRVGVRQGAAGARGGPGDLRAMDRWIEAADWIVWQLCGEETRNVCTAGYKGIHQDGGYPSPRVPRGAEPGLRRLRRRTSSSTRCRSSARAPGR